ncbi:hypothetical protein LCALC10_1775 [Lacticaseibacillus paracasei]|nr:hypothetical protein LCALC10_1775 [Lacticaseibacillus paracasei]
MSLLEKLCLLVMVESPSLNVLFSPGRITHYLFNNMDAK